MKHLLNNQVSIILSLSGSVSPNVGHLILKYLCPAAVRDVLQDGLRAYVLDIIIGQRRNQPWSVVEASTQLGETQRQREMKIKINKIIMMIMTKISDKITFGFISLPWTAHYQPWGFLSLSQGACQPMLEELLLLLQPLSLLPFDLDLLFEPRQLQKGQEHLKRKEQLCSTRHGLDQSAQRSKQAGWWFQLMQSSQVYIDNSAHGSKFVKWEKRKKGGAEGRRQSHPPPREGVVEGAEANHESDERAETERTNSTSGRDRRAGNTGVFDQLGLPSGWLSLDRSVLDLVVQSVGVGKRADEVRALCHHIATEPGHLSFHKGDVLQVATPRGLVPIIYVL
uniref:Uncharacterized protein n=1 Tax=Astyanax mexicanus TaxID=7994 RepID=A0A3B1J0T7_ASTMX